MPFESRVAEGVGTLEELGTLTLPSLTSLGVRVTATPAAAGIAVACLGVRPATEEFTLADEHQRRRHQYLHGDQHEMPAVDDDPCPT